MDTSASAHYLLSLRWNELELISRYKLYCYYYAKELYLQVIENDEIVYPKSIIIIIDNRR